MASGNNFQDLMGSPPKARTRKLKQLSGLCTLHSLSFPFSLFPWPNSDTKDVPGEGKEKMGEKDKRSVRQWSLFLESNLESQTHAV